MIKQEKVFFILLVLLVHGSGSYWHGFVTVKDFSRDLTDPELVTYPRNVAKMSGNTTVELLTNGDFETGSAGQIDPQSDLSGWPVLADNGGTYSMEDDSTNYLKITNADSTNDDGGYNQTIALTWDESADYVISGRMGLNVDGYSNAQRAYLSVYIRGHGGYGDHPYSWLGRYDIYIAEDYEYDDSYWAGFNCFENLSPYTTNSWTVEDTGWQSFSFSLSDRMNDFTMFGLDTVEGRANISYIDVIPHLYTTESNAAEGYWDDISFISAINPVELVANGDFETDSAGEIDPQSELSNWSVYEDNGGTYWLEEDGDQHLKINNDDFANDLGGYNQSIAFTWDESLDYNISGSMRMNADGYNGVQRIYVMLWIKGYGGQGGNDIGSLGRYVIHMAEDHTYDEATNWPGHDCYENLSPYTTNSWPAEDTGWQSFNFDFDERISDFDLYNLDTVAGRANITAIDVMVYLLTDGSQDTDAYWDDISFVKISTDPVIAAVDYSDVINYDEPLDINITVSEFGGPSVTNIEFLHSTDGLLFTPVNMSYSSMLDKWIVQLSAMVTEYGQVYRLKFNLETSSGNSITYDNDGEYYTVTVIDRDAPVINYIPSTSRLNNEESFTITCEITEPGGASGINSNSVILEYKDNITESVQEKSLQFDSGYWKTELDPLNASLTINYRIKSQDMAGNEKVTDWYEFEVIDDVLPRISYLSLLDHVLPLDDVFSFELKIYDGGGINNVTVNYSINYGNSWVPLSGELINEWSPGNITYRFELPLNDHTGTLQFYTVVIDNHGNMAYFGSNSSDPFSSASAAKNDPVIVINDGYTGPAMEIPELIFFTDSLAFTVNLTGSEVISNLTLYYTVDNGLNWDSINGEEILTGISTLNYRLTALPSKKSFFFELAVDRNIKDISCYFKASGVGLGIGNVYYTLEGVKNASESVVRNDPAAVINSGYTGPAMEIPELISFADSLAFTVNLTGSEVISNLTLYYTVDNGLNWDSINGEEILTGISTLNYRLTALPSKKSFFFELTVEGNIKDISCYFKASGVGLGIGNVYYTLEGVKFTGESAVREAANELNIMNTLYQPYPWLPVVALVMFCTIIFAGMTVFAAKKTGLNIDKLIRNSLIRKRRRTETIYNEPIDSEIV